MKKRIVTATALAVSLLLIAQASASASASDDTEISDIEYALEVVPGGIALSDRYAVWPALGMTLTAGSSAARSVGSCATGTFCAYTGSGLSGTKLAFAICTNVSTAALRVVASIANGRTSGKVHAKNSSGTVLGTAVANGSANVSPGTASLLCTL
ncbi:hypothetical protein DXT68_00275 [Microbacterium foliorum]|uniref:Uncharacterized protein n=1 Tax=Microbacterium foliorum TaxID=104336 RepID=A0A0F0KMX2_9MICO|nr:hypothetical protein [Microbacterium foliorum]AXL10753.1 hypothetical protein DXT68_00275 [Microbacterium foliorum]KJL21789.1 hypothetical protein RN50_01690 [Microbacterium foliorum]